ncbi:hyaluronidase Tab y 2.0101-like [Eupeodes corollae]|uniref:hyaluronidase Tab y 2.0101-like n=1 Tax=Eupeodes corollae TaxID=290404 RepID=UPI00249143C8|nr:hyaluronidase Tab y 2.0101-like [Eupeodes corollae]XP_055920409.1 hyaluronidase Tab y 2.0101-like [Eupeodes corollae]XP_055920410.1 hyaluronidase Tab y 2.0101-like [Eupeodes corollae]
MDFATWLFGSLMFYFWICTGASDFKFYWNIPSFMCKKYQITFDRLLTEYGIIQNQNDSFRGDKISILYDPGNFPAILQNTSSKEFVYRNHGVPQEGNLSAHLELFEKQLAELIPDSNFSGIAIIDFESWRPIYRQNFGVLKPYKALSMQIEQKKHPRWSKAQVEKEAESNFEIGAKVFMINTLLTAKKMRPYGKWGYYAFPYCFNNGNGFNPEQCAKGVHDENNMIQWMFQSSDVIYPSVYLQERIPPFNRIPFVRGRVSEALRVAKMSDEKVRPQVLVYHRYVFTDTLRQIDAATTFNIFQEIKQNGADGIVLWGSSYDLDTKAKCQQFQIYLKEKLGPAVRLASHLGI